jgi:type II secretory pathway pseudopilin PulG
MLKILSLSTTAPSRRRRGFTLVEMLVAMACTILLMYAITQTFQNIGEVSARGRAAIEISTQLRGVQIRLHKDFESLTVPVRPWANPEVAPGYFEILEGVTRDDPTGTTRPNVYGDLDDLWAMTIRSTGEPFVGRYNGTMIQSQVAEVIWFTSYNDRDGNNALDLTTQDTMNLHRRVLLVRPDLNGANGNLGVSTATTTFWQDNDLSVRMSGGMLAANSLVDLTQRENRFAHVSGVYPTDGNGLLSKDYILAGNRQGEDVMLSNVLAADIRVFDRLAQVKASEDKVEALSPGDPGYAETIDPAHAFAHATLGTGAYVDLWYSRYLANAPVTEFSGQPDSKSTLATATYDTWSLGYELTGPAFDGVDSAPSGGGPLNGAIDDVTERVSSPPYPVPLRGVQIRLRVLEPETRQVRQSTIVQDFIPE